MTLGPFLFALGLLAAFFDLGVAGRFGPLAGLAVGCGAVFVFARIARAVAR